MKRNPYKQGFNDGINRARQTLKQDISMIYGMMCVIEIEEGKTEDEVIDLMDKIQKRWNDVAQTEEGVLNYLERTLPFVIEQIIR